MRALNDAVTVAGAAVAPFIPFTVGWAAFHMTGHVLVAAIVAWLVLVVGVRWVAGGGGAV